MSSDPIGDNTGRPAFWIGLLSGAIVSPALVVGMTLVLTVRPPPKAVPGNGPAAVVSRLAPGQRAAAPVVAAAAATPATFASCAACHGMQGEGMAVLNAPRLAGLPDWYLYASLAKYRSGQRGSDPRDLGGMQMRPMALTLADDAAVDAVVAAIGTLRPTTTPDVLEGGDPRRGELHYGVCIACHGAAAEGRPEVGGPPLTGQHGWYLLTQFQNFQRGIRGSDAADGAGTLMRSAVQFHDYDEQTVRDLLAYIATLDTQGR